MASSTSSSPPPSSPPSPQPEQNPAPAAAATAVATPTAAPASSTNPTTPSAKAVAGEIRRDILRDWNVLVVDDEPDSLEVAVRILKFYGANVTTAANGREGLSEIKSNRPRFVISDLSMPDMDGWEMLYEVKKDRTTLDIPVIALTAHAMAGDRERAIMAGFHNYLTKPLTPATFMKDLLRLLMDVPEFASELAVTQS